MRGVRSRGGGGHREGGEEERNVHAGSQVRGAGLKGSSNTSAEAAGVKERRWF